MNRMVLRLAWCVLLSAAIYADDPAGAYVVGEIKAIVDGPTGTDVITDLDIAQHRFAGDFDLDALILMYAKTQHAESTGISITQDDVDRYLRALSQQGQPSGQALTPDSLRAMAHDLGCSLDELYAILKKLYTANVTMEQDVHSQLTITEQQVEAAYNADPAYKDGVYFLQTAHVPLEAGQSKAERKRDLIKNAGAMKDLSWSIPFDINDSELAVEKSFVKKMKRGDIYVYELSDGFELYRLTNRTERKKLSLEERKKDILSRLREQKIEQTIKQYNQDRLGEVVVTKF